MKVALSRNIIFRKNRFRIFFFKVKSLVSFCTVNYRGSPFFREATSMPLCLRESDFRANQFFFFNLFSCANRHTIRSPITDNLRPCTIYIDIRPIFPLETTQWNTSYFDELHISFPSFTPFRDMILWKKIERSNLGRCQHLWKLLSPFFSAIQALKIS